MKTLIPSTFVAIMSESASATSGPKFRIDVNDMVSRIPVVRNFRWYREYRKANSLKHEYRERVSHHAEAKVAATLRKMKGMKHVAMEVRIPAPESNQNGEVDIIAIHEKAILFVEVKNWTGKVVLEDGKIKQIKTKGNDITDPAFSKLEFKANSFRSLYRSRIGKEVPEVIPMLVFSNTNAMLGELLGARIDVVEFNDMKKSFSKRLKPLEKIPDEERQHCREIIEMCGSWDAMEFRGGKALKGDFTDSKLPSFIKREDVRSAHFDNINGFLKTIFRGPKLVATLKSWEGEKYQLDFTSAETIDFVEPWARDENPTHNLWMLYGLRFGYRHEVSWENQTGSRTHSGKNAYKNFEKGKKYHGTVINWIDSGILVSLENSKNRDHKVNGIIPMKLMGNEMEVEMKKAIYTEGKGIDVVVTSSKSNRGVNLKFSDG